MSYDPSTLIPAYKKKVNELFANDNIFKQVVEEQVSNFRSMATSSTNGITLKQGIAGIVAGKPKLYGLNRSPYFKENRGKYKVLKIMHKEITRLPLNILTNSSKKSVKKSAKSSAKKPTTLNMDFLPGPSGLPGAMQRIPSSTMKPNPYRAALRKKRKATKKNKPSKRSKASKKSKSSKKTRRRTRRRRY